MTITTINAKGIADWLGTNYTNDDDGHLICVPYPPVIPDFPDSIVVVTMTGSGGYDYDRAFEVRTFQIRCRSPQNNPDIAEQNSTGIDTLFGSMMMPWEPNGIQVIEVGRVGGGPMPMPVDDTSNRYSWVCNYYCKAATGY